MLFGVSDVVTVGVAIIVDVAVVGCNATAAVTVMRAVIDIVVCCVVYVVL